MIDKSRTVQWIEEMFIEETFACLPNQLSGNIVRNIQHHNLCGSNALPALSLENYYRELCREP